jgi:hypothetical protein
MSVALAQAVVLAGTAFLLVAGLIVAAGRYRDAKLLGLLTEEERRLERCAERVRELAEIEESGAFALAHVRLVEALSVVHRNLPQVRRLLFLPSVDTPRVREQAGNALAEIADAVLETRIERDLYTFGFGWARKRRRELDERISAVPLRRAA